MKRKIFTEGNGNRISNIPSNRLSNDSLENIRLSAKKLNDIGITQYLIDTLSNPLMGSNTARIENLIPKDTVNNLEERMKNLSRIFTTYNDFIQKPEKEYFVAEQDGIKYSLPDKIDNVILLTELVKNISYKECLEFQNHIATYPMLGMNHEVGKKIYNAIKSSKTVDINGIELYRIRKPLKRDKRPYVANEMFEPAYLYTPQGRFSSIGLSYLYFSENLETAKKETLTKETQKYTYIGVTLKKAKKMIDVTELSVPLFSLCHEEKERVNKALEINYLLPNFIGNCADALGYDGIISWSIKNNITKNYTFFSASRLDFDVKNIEGVNFKKK